MSDVAASIFGLSSRHGVTVPKLGIFYEETDTDTRWHINCGGTRGYAIRIGTELNSYMTSQAPDAYFIMQRVTTSLFLAGIGLFQATPTGRVHFTNLDLSECVFSTDLDIRKKPPGSEDTQVASFEDWFRFICTHNHFRRAADDMYYALTFPLESIFFMYRAMEWLLKAGNIGWKQLAGDIGVTYTEIREFKRMANATLGQRHGVRSGKKSRAMPIETASGIADLVYALASGRKRIEPTYPGMTPRQAAAIVRASMPADPYI